MLNTLRMQFNDGAYLLGELLGRGGMGQVHEARDRAGRRVAVKRLRDTLSNDLFSLGRFGDEQRLLRRVCHPNVVRALDDGVTAGGTPYLVMAHAPGVALDRLIKRGGPLSVERTVAIAAQLLAGLAAIHDAGIAHGDIKSSNVLVDDDDSITIIDFGLACMPSGAAADGRIAGTPEYMAPELIGGELPTTRADLYAVGTVMYEMLTGATPFGGGPATAVLARQLHEPVVPPSLRAPDRAIPLALERVVLRALAKPVDARFASAAAFAEELDQSVAREVNMRSTVDLWANEPTRQHRRTRAPARAAGDSDAVAARRHQLRLAVTAGSHDPIIGGYLALAQALLEDRRAADAVGELEQALARFAPGDDGLSSEPSLWRIQTVLAALYDSMGKQERARRLARIAYQQALHSGCELAELRTRALVARLSARKPVPTTMRPRFSVEERAARRGSRNAR